MSNNLTINGVSYQVLQLLGKGKGGYSYLVENDGVRYVLKQIHHEPCDYYTFGDKLQSELRDYQRLQQVGVRMPRMLAVDAQNERILKEYIHGPTVDSLVKEDASVDRYLAQVREMAMQVYAAGLNIDYFPTNFVVSGGLIYYVDYECNEYMEQWNFENWGIKYWSKTPEFLAYWRDHP